MSDSTATAREPSMEDILASIRRIIDEEDTRDARPASDLAVDPDEDGDGAQAGSLPVMAAASVDRDDDTRAHVAAFDEDEDDAPDGASVFPERESLFWSRATGRGDSPEGDADEAPAATAPDGDESRDAEDARGGPRTDIFRRAQSKLGSMTRPGARERIQSLAARAEERAGSAAEEGRESLADFTGSPVPADGSDDGQDDVAGAVAALADAGADAVEDRAAPDLDALDGDGILDLTEPLDPVEAPDERASTRFDGLSDDEDRMDMTREDAPRPAQERAAPNDPESLRHMVESDDDDIDEGREDGRDEDMREDALLVEDVLDLTMPLTEESATVDEGSVESGDSFHVSTVEETPDGDDIEDAISLNLGMADGESVQDSVQDAEDRVAGMEAGAEDDGRHDDDGQDTHANTYSRFDSEPEDSVSTASEVVSDDGIRDDGDDAGMHRGATDDVAMDADDATEDDVRETGFAGLAMPLADDTIHDDAVAETAQADDALDDDARAESTHIEDTHPEDAHLEGTHAEDIRSEDTASDESGAMPDAPDTYAAAFTMLGDPPSEEGASGFRTGNDTDDLDHLDMGDELGFSDTFSASDVYHDDPPVLDEDYSRSLDVEDEPVAAQATRDDEPQDNGMEKVGGLVRDAMERDPVDYADPSALVSMTSEEISARALASLADVEGEASRRMFGSLRISDDDGSESLEGMVRGMLRPLLREWLDDNLPTMVETAVRGEVERISAKSRKYSRAADKD